MQIVSNGHNLHEMPNPVFKEKKKKNFNMLSTECCLLLSKAPFTIVAHNILKYFIVLSQEINKQQNFRMLFAAIVIGALKANIVCCCDIFLYNNLYTAPDERLSSKIFFLFLRKKSTHYNCLYKAASNEK